MAGWFVQIVGAVLLAVPLMAVALQAVPVDHSAWQQLLQQYVDQSGRVAYRQLKEQGRNALAQYVNSLGAASIDGLPSNDQLAFWINAYNATVVAGIVDGYSPETKVSRFELFRLSGYIIAGQTRSPDDIEKIARGFHDPRVHFALVCASTSCPPLRREAYVGNQLDAQLTDQARRFLRDPGRNIIDTERGVAELSQIFNWFQDDFTHSGGSLADFLAPYLTRAQDEALRHRPIQYLDYDWTLNVQPGERP